MSNLPNLRLGPVSSNRHPQMSTLILRDTLPFFELIFVLVVHTLLPLYICSRVTSFGIRHSLHSIRSTRTVCDCEYVNQKNSKFYSVWQIQKKVSILVCKIFELACFFSKSHNQVLEYQEHQS